MAKATLTFIDTPEGIDIETHFEPPLVDSPTQPPSVHCAVQAANLLRKYLHENKWIESESLSIERINHHAANDAAHHTTEPDQFDLAEPG